MQDFKTFYDMAGELGLVGLVALYLVYQIFTNIKVREVVKSVRELLAKADRTREDYPPNVSGAIEISRIIGALLDSLLHDLNADRAYIMQYHNGGCSISGIPFVRMSCNHERVQVGVEPQIASTQRWPVASLTSINCAVAEKRKMHVPDIEEVNQAGDASTYMTLKTRGVRSMYATALLNEKLIPIGFVGIEYLRDQRTLGADDLKCFEAISMKICGLLLPSQCGVGGLEGENHGQGSD